MELERISFSYITTASSLYNKIIDLRYKTFFQPFQLSRNIVKDELDEISLHLIASGNNEVLGYIRLTIKNGEAMMSQMVVDPSVRKKGIGRELIKRAIEKIKNAGIEKVSLNSRLNALKFYERFGFKTVGNVFSSKKTALLHMRMEKALT